MDPHAEDTYLFQHALTHQAAYDLMPPSVRAQLHAGAASLLEREEGALLAAASAEIAHHLATARRMLPALAAELAPREYAACLRGAEWLRQRYRIDDGVRLLQQAARIPAISTTQRIDALLRTIEALDISGRYAAADPVVEELLPLTRGTHGLDVLRAAMAEHHAGLVAWRRGRTTEGRALIADALARARTAGDADLLLRAVGNLAAIAREFGDTADSAAGYAEAQRLAEASGDQRRLAIVTGNLGDLKRAIGELEESEVLTRRALAISAACGDRRSEGAWHGNLSILLASMGRAAEAEAELDLALRIADAIGDRHHQSFWGGERGNRLRHARRFAEAEAAYARAIQIAREIGALRIEAIHLVHLASALMDSGDAGRAQPIAAQACASAHAVAARGLEGFALATLGRIDWKLGSVSAAEASFRQAHALFHTTDAGSLLADLERSLGGLLVETGRADEGMPMILRALETAQRLRDPNGESMAQDALADALEFLGRHAEADAARARARALAPGASPGR